MKEVDYDIFRKSYRELEEKVKEATKIHLMELA